MQLFRAETERRIKMEANELMTGDYVRVGKDGLCIPKDTIVKIRAIDELNSLVLQSGKRLTGSVHCQPAKDAFFSGGIWVDYLEPIPITAEILEKNGFKLHAISEIYELVSPKKDWFVAIGFKDGCIDWCKVHRWGDEYLGSIKYVHELQRALRLLKINKDIAL